MVGEIQLNLCNSTALGVLGICSNYMIFRIIGSLAILAKFPGEKTIKKGKYSNFENRKCLSVTQIYLTIYLHI